MFSVHEFGRFNAKLENDDPSVTSGGGSVEQKEELLNSMSLLRRPDIHFSITWLEVEFKVSVRYNVDPCMRFESFTSLKMVHFKTEELRESTLVCDIG